VVEAPPSDPDWQGINDRLRRAAHDSSAVLAGFKK
jgi:L-threonylcarbamoyladenylate synthase